MGRVRHAGGTAEGRGPAARAFAWLVAGPLAFIVMALWVVVAVAAVRYLPPLGQSASTVGDITPAHLPALRVEQRSAAVFGNTVLSRVAVVQRDPAGLNRDARDASAKQALGVAQGQATGRYPELMAALPVLNDHRVIPGANEDGTTIVTYLYFDPASSWVDQERTAELYAGDLRATPGAGVVGVTGSIPARMAQDDQIFSHLGLVEIATVLVIGLILAVTFRSLVAPAVALTAGVLSYTVALRLVEWAGQRSGFAAPVELQPLMVVLLLGIVTDYAIFLLAGFRRQLAAGVPRARAARLAVAENAPIIATAGLMVAAGTAVLVVADLRFFRAFGPGLALTVLVGLVVALTLVPALLAVLGRVVFWPSRVAAPDPPGPGPVADAAEGTPRSLRARVLHRATSRPVAIVVAALAVGALLAASYGLRNASLGFDLVNGLPRSSETRKAADAATSGFAEGILSPTEVLVQGSSLAERRASLEHLQELIGKQPGVAGVAGPKEEALGMVAATAASQGSAAGSGAQTAVASAAQDPGLAIAPDGTAARYVVVLSGDPLGSSGIDQYEQLAGSMPAMLRQSDLQDARASFAGDTAVTAQTIDATLNDLVRIAIAVLIVDLVLLIIFLRALVAPVYLLAASVLALTAAAGVTVFVSQRVFGVTDLTYYVPFAAAVLLVSLGSDYNIFLMGQIWQQARVRPLREAIETGVPRATRPISIAAITLAASFGLLALVPLTAFKQLALLLAVGILVDSFVVRSLLVPALVAAVGPASAWPGRLRRAEPRAATQTPAEAEARRAA